MPGVGGSSTGAAGGALPARPGKPDEEDDLNASDVPEDPAWAEEFTALCDRHRGRLVRWLTAIFGPRDAEDIAQETFARLYARPGLLTGSDPWPWLAVVARNVGRDLARHNAFTTPVGSDTLDQLPGHATVADAVVARENAERLARALRHISPRDRALLQLREVQGVPIPDIAAQLGMNDNAVRQQLHRARRRLAHAYVGMVRRPPRRRPPDRPPGHAGRVRP